MSFETLEEQVVLRVVGDGRGHLERTGELRDIAGIGNRLIFALNFDQTYLPAIRRQLDALIDSYPVLGQP